jgi:hypothetical protein
MQSENRDHGDVLVSILDRFRSGEVKPDKDTPPWINEILALEERDKNRHFDRADIKDIIQRNSIPDNTLHSSPIASERIENRDPQKTK